MSSLNYSYNKLINDFICYIKLFFQNKILNTDISQNEGNIFNSKNEDKNKSNENTKNKKIDIDEKEIEKNTIKKEKEKKKALKNI